MSLGRRDRVKIAVSKGHNVYNNGRFDNGAIGYKKEAEEVDKMVDILIPLLRSQGHQVYDVTPKNRHFKNSKEAHRERARRVNAINPDIYLDTHLNSGGGTGPETWTYNNKGLAYEYAKKINKNIAEATGLRNRGEKISKGMWSLSMVKCPAIILEGGFVDSKIDMERLTPEVYARSVAKAFGEVKEGKRLTKEEVLKIIRGERENIENSTMQKWQEEAINFVTEKGFMNGYPGGEFKPNKAVTRGELAQVLYNLYK